MGNEKCVYEEDLAGLLSVRETVVGVRAQAYVLREDVMSSKKNISASTYEKAIKDLDIIIKNTEERLRKITMDIGNFANEITEVQSREAQQNSQEEQK